MIRTYLRFSVAEGAADGLVNLFREEQILETAITQPGCRSAELTLSTDGSSAIVTAAWDSPQAYEAWTRRSDRGHLSQRLNQYLSEPIDAGNTGASYHIVHTGDGRTHPSEHLGEEST